MPFSEKVLKFIEKENLFDNSDQLLVAVSGGIDSMALLYMLYRADYQVSVAHVNYKLRGKDSDKDQELVEAFCKSSNIDCHSYVINQKESTSLREGNLQEKARNIRYRFFNELKEQYHYPIICTAHHSDDRIETMLLNLTRGSSIKGLTALSATNGAIVRPFLSISRRDIEQYVLNEGIKYRKDQSNDSNKYERNFIRNEIITLIKERIPRSEIGFAKSARHLEEDVHLLNDYLNTLRQQWINEDEAIIKLGPLNSFKELNHAQVILYKLLEPYGFNRTQSDNLINSHTTEEVYVSSGSHEAIIKNNELIIRVAHHLEINDVVIVAEGHYDYDQGSITIVSATKPDYNNNDKEEYVQIDFSKGPLIIRPYIVGDSFQPFGLTGRTKKLSDYFGDLGLNRFEKEHIRLLTQNNQIIWVIGRRIDHRYSIRGTENIYKLCIS